MAVAVQATVRRPQFSATVRWGKVIPLRAEFLALTDFRLTITCSIYDMGIVAVTPSADSR